jgi:murein DD-endopeptidase MepM/ murein hydrolase activator NlpD
MRAAEGSWISMIFEKQEMTGSPRKILRSFVTALLCLAFSPNWIQSASCSSDRSDGPVKQDCDKMSIPTSFESPFGSYPNLLNITQEDRQSGLFHPVIVYPEELLKLSALPVSDCRYAEGLASTEEVARAKQRAFLRKWRRQISRSWWKMLRLIGAPSIELNAKEYSIGKYDENRVRLYSSELFDNTAYTIDGFRGRRTVHLGIDLSAPVGTPVHSFSDGIVHSVGYNAELGDYGHVIVIEHFWEPSSGTLTNSATLRVWALYGHLDKSAMKKKGEKSRQAGDRVLKGEVLGSVGDTHENGGWIAPHVHFQLSMGPPDQPHDMPGAVSVEDRISALLKYPDPRYVLGPLY